MNSQNADRIIRDFAGEQETIRSILFEASDAMLRLELFTRNKQLTDEQLTKLAGIADRIDGILNEQQREAA